jgi:trehalose synthase-fused probable maltokinase
MADLDLRRIGEERLIAFVTEQRWYASKTREIARAAVLDVVPLDASGSPRCYVALVEVGFHPGTHETYQVLLGAREAGEGWSEGVVGKVDGWTVYDGVGDPAVARSLVRAMWSGTTAAGEEGEVELRASGVRAEPPPLDRVRVWTGEQSNSSVVCDETLILKLYRRLEAGINPELELLRFLTARGFPNVAALHGWYGYAGPPLEATLGILQEYVEGRSDGWELALDAIATDPDAFLEHVGRLGEVTGAMHAALAEDASDPAFAPEEASVESLGLLVASVDEEVGRVFLDLPDDVEALQPIAGRGEEVRDRLRLLSHAGSGGRVIRHHGDYHLGQVLWTGGDWVVLDFEGEPARSLSERRQKRSPLRDVAGMLRSFAYAAEAAPLLRGVEAPDDFEERARADFLAGYLATVDSSLLPAGEEALERLLVVFELEKAVYELRYELDNRPDWVRIPVAAIERLLGAAVS